MLQGFAACCRIVYAWVCDGLARTLQGFEGFLYTSRPNQLTQQCSKRVTCPFFINGPCSGLCEVLGMLGVACWQTLSTSTSAACSNHPSPRRLPWRCKPPGMSWWCPTDTVLWVLWGGLGYFRSSISLRADVNCSCLILCLKNITLRLENAPSCVLQHSSSI